MSTTEPTPTPEERLSKKPFLRSLLVDLAIACVCSAAIMSLLGAKSPRDAAREKERVERVRRVAGEELSFARERAAPEEVRSSVATLAAFMRRRANVALDPALGERLVTLEQRALDGRLGRVPVEEASAIFSELLCERIRDLDDAEIESAADAFGNVIPVGKLEAYGDDTDTRFAVAKRLRGVPPDPSAGAKPGPRNDVMLRVDGTGIMPADAFVERLKEIRATLQAPHTFVLVTSQGRRLIEDYLGERVDMLATALPESWGAARSFGLTPVQVVLLAYSSASDDSLTWSTAELAARQERSIDAYVARAGRPEALGRRAPFGRYGDLFSTPLDVALDATTLGRLLDAVEERGDV